MSIRDELQQRVLDERLAEFETIPPMSKYRNVFLVPAVNAQIVGPWEPGGYDARAMPMVRADLENFIINARVTATFKRGPQTNFRRLQPKRGKPPKVWECRTLAPPPGNRLLGFFAEADVFVGVEMIERDTIDFEAEIRRANAAWHNLFPTYEPVVSENINDYFSENVVLLR